MLFKSLENVLNRNLCHSMTLWIVVFHSFSITTVLVLTAYIGVASLNITLVSLKSLKDARCWVFLFLCILIKSYWGYCLVFVVIVLSFTCLWNRPIGAVIYMQRTNLKMCLRTIDSCIDTSEIAKVLQHGWQMMLVHSFYAVIYRQPHIQ